MQKAGKHCQRLWGTEGRGEGGRGRSFLAFAGGSLYFMDMFGRAKGRTIFFRWDLRNHVENRERCLGVFFFYFPCISFIVECGSRDA